MEYFYLYTALSEFFTVAYDGWMELLDTDPFSPHLCIFPGISAVAKGARGALCQLKKLAAAVAQLYEKSRLKRFSVLSR